MSGVHNKSNALGKAPRSTAHIRDTVTVGKQQVSKPKPQNPPKPQTKGK